MQDSELLVQTHMYLSTVKYYNCYLQSSCCQCIVCGVQIVGKINGKAHEEIYHDLSACCFCWLPPLPLNLFPTH